MSGPHSFHLGEGRAVGPVGRVRPLGRFGMRWLAGVCASVALVAAAQQPTPPGTLPRNLWIEVPPEPLNDWSRHFRIGMLVGFNLKASFRLSGEFSVSGSQPGATNVSGLDHFYDDGYVRVDETGNALGKTIY